MSAPSTHSASLGALIAAVAALCICADARAETSSEESILPVDVTQIVQEALAEVPLPEDVTALVEQASAPSPATASPAPAPAIEPVEAQPPLQQPQPPAPSAVKPVRYQPVQPQYRAPTPSSSPPREPVVPSVPPLTSAPAPQPAPAQIPAPRPAPAQDRAAPPAQSPASVCDTESIRGLLGAAEACNLSRRLSVNSILEFVARYQLLLEQYQLPATVDPVLDSAQTAAPAPELPALSTVIEIHLPESVAGLPEAALQPVVGLLSPQPARHALPPAARELGLPPRPPTMLPEAKEVASGARAVAAPGEPWRAAAPPAAAPADPPARAGPSAPARAARPGDRAERPAPPAPLVDLRSAAGTAPGGASASTGGSSSAGGAALAATLLMLSLALDLLRRLRLEPAQPRSERIDSFPERPG
jgi:hypothetical protein